MRTTLSWTSPSRASTAVRSGNRASARRCRCSTCALSAPLTSCRNASRSSGPPWLATRVTTAPSTAGSEGSEAVQRRRASVTTDGSSARVPAAASTAPRSRRVRSSSLAVGSQPRWWTTPSSSERASAARISWRSGATRSIVPSARRTACHTARSRSVANAVAKSAKVAGSWWPARVAAHRSSTAMARSAAVSRAGRGAAGREVR